MKRWPTKPLGELITIEKGKKASEAFTAPSRTSLRYLQIEDLRPYANVKYCEPFSCPRATKADAIIAWDGANAGTVSCNLEGHVGSTLAILRPIAANSLSAPFLSRFLQGNFGHLRKTATGATVPHISKSALTALRLPLPPLAEQERIVKLLDDADELRRLRAQADRRTADLIPALFHEMFGEAGKYPQQRLESICEFITKGTTPSAGEISDEPINDSVPFLKVYHVTDDGGIDFNYRPSFISRALHQSALKRSRVYPGDVLMNIVGPPLGRIGLVPESYPEWNVNQALAIFRPKSGQLISLYLLHALRSSTALSAILANAVGVRQLNLSLEQCRNATIPVPPVQMQQYFAMRVAEIRELEARQAASRERLNALFQSMLHRAFGGEL